MPLFIIYLIKANIALTIFYLAYRLVLKRLTFYHLNRFFLLFGIVISTLFPLINFSSFFQHHQKVSTAVSSYAPNWQKLQTIISPETFTVWSVVEYIFFIGVVAMTIRFLMHFLSILQIHIKSKKASIQNEKVNQLSGRKNPFSFFKNIYLNPTLYNNKELATILTHEKIHVKGWHSIDIMIGELNTIFYWFNPGAWLIKTAIRENLEFITDHKILTAGMNPKQYQYSLLRSATGLSTNQLTNHFNLFHLKNRIKMMNKNKSSRRHLLMYVILTPIVAAAIFAFTTSRGQNIQTPPQNKTTPKTDTLSPPKSISYKAFVKKNPSVSLLYWGPKTENIEPIIKVTLKNGKTETYHLNNPKEMKKAREKYGSFPSPLVDPSSNHKNSIKYTPPTSDSKDSTIDPQKEYSEHFLKNNPNVKLISILHSPGGDTTIYLTLKNETKEVYHIANPKEAKAFKKKYGALPPHGKKSPVYSFVQKMPHFPGGQKSLMQYLNKHLKYPLKAKEKGIQGTVVVQFVVEKDGSLTHLKTRGEKKGYGLEEEALRIVKNMPKWNPGSQDGKAVRTKFALPIRFVLNHASKKSSSVSKTKDNQLAEKALDALKLKDIAKAEGYAKKALALNPKNTVAPQVLDYVAKMKAYQEKMRQYHKAQKEHSNKKSKTTIHYTPPNVIVDTVKKPTPKETFLSKLPPNKIEYKLDGKKVDKAYLKNHLRPEDIYSIKVRKDSATLSKLPKGKDGLILIETKKNHTQKDAHTESNHPIL